MIESILLFLGGAAACIVLIALRQRVPGESWLTTISRPFGAGGPGPRQ